MAGEKTRKRGDSWIVGFWAAIFAGLARISIFDAILRLGRGRYTTAGFVEAYVLANSLAGFALLAIVTHWTLPRFAALILLAYAAIRIFEIVVYQVNVLLFDEYRAARAGNAYAVHGYRRIVLLLIHNYFEIVCWFGVIYILLYQWGHLAVGPGLPDPNFVSVFRESLLLMFSFTGERYATTGDTAVVVFSLHAAVGIFMTMLAFARFLALLPNPASKDPFEN